MSRSGASRKSRAWRVGGVSRTTRSKRSSARQLEQLLHRHVLVAAREGGRDLLVEAVLQDAPPGRGAPGVALHERVEGALGVEGHGPERARRRVRRRGVSRSSSAGPVRELLEAEAGGQAARGVDRADEHAPARAAPPAGRGPPRSWSCRRRPSRTRRARGARRGARREARAGGGPHAAARRSARAWSPSRRSLGEEEGSGRGARPAPLQARQVEARQLAAADVAAARRERRRQGHAAASAPAGALPRRGAGSPPPARS